ncbi:ABC transporter permease [Corynebacterium casei]|uniref:ABC transporter permease n=1 Tax=Corynebacterium casei TaxID=160386 RepID=UPI003FD538AD
MGKRNLHGRWRRRSGNDAALTVNELARMVPSSARDAISVSVDGMRSLDARPGLFRYVALLRQRRHFVKISASARAFQANKDLLLGQFWLVASPVVESLMFILVFGVLLDTSRGVDNFIGFVVLGVTFFGFLQRHLSSGTRLVQKNKGMIKSFVFPRAAVVFSESLRLLFDSLPAALVAVIFGLITSGRVPWTIVLIIPVFLLLHLFGTGLMFIGARITAFVPDMQVIINVAQRGWFFGSGVFFSVDHFAGGDLMTSLMKANPGYIFLTAVRDTVLYGAAPSLAAWLQMLAWALGLFIIGFIYFWQAEERYVGVD